MTSTTPSISLPFLTAYDPPGTSEGNLDPMGLYQIADQLATLLAPAVRKRMQRVRFLSAMAGSRSISVATLHSLGAKELLISDLADAGSAAWKSNG